MLTANIGVLLGIGAVVLELRQTQLTMRAEASSVRTQMNLHIGELRIEYGMHNITEKVLTGEALTADEEARLRRIQISMLRYFEHLHYQNEIGVLDEEIWVANYNSIGRLCNVPVFKYIFPDWPNVVEASRFRSSFVELVSQRCPKN